MNDFESEMRELAAQLAADPVEDDGAAYVDGVAGKADGIGFSDDDSLFGWVERLDPVKRQVIEGVGEVHHVAAFEGCEAGVEVVEAGIDKMERHDRNAPDVVECAVAGERSARTVAYPQIVAGSREEGVAFALEGCGARGVDDGVTCVLKPAVRVLRATRRLMRGSRAFCTVPMAPRPTSAMI